MSRQSRRMDKQGLRILRAHEYELAVGRLCTDAVPPAPCTGGKAAPPSLIGGKNGKFIGKMDIGERKAAIGIDWLQGTIPFEKLQLVLEYLTNICGAGYEEKAYGLYGYQACAEFHPFGILVLWDTDQSRRKQHGDRICLQICGSGISCFPPDSLLRFMRDLSLKFWFKGSRIDLAFDDYEKIIMPLEVWKIAEQGSYSGFRKHGIEGDTKRNGNDCGKTVRFGRRGKNGSGKYLRCYDKEKESKGEINSVRWEVVFSKASADKIFFDLAFATDETDLARKIGAYIGGCIDFIERSENGHINELDRLAFWEQIIHHLGKAALRCGRPEGSIETSMEWVESSVSPCLKKLRKALGDEAYLVWIEGHINKARLTEKAEGQVRAYYYQSGVPAPF
ncbi:replication initiation factor domain-containing protein [Pontiellaceae bacterium B12219]|nr:replication initiation factor domain-containing protein [Pontiellaceae bacterium B12219]